MTSASTEFPEQAAEAPAAPRHPIALPHFRNLWIGSTISLLGDQFFLVALPWLVLQLTGSSVALGTIMMVAGVPRAALMLVGGVVIDRFSARRVLITTAAIRAVLVGAVALLLWLKMIALWQLYGLSLAFGVADAFSLPAGPTLIPTLVRPDQLRPANSLMQSSTVMTQMIGPAPAGLLIKRWGTTFALCFDALSFLAVIAALFRLPDPPKAPSRARPGMWNSIVEGLRAVRNDPPLWSFIVVIATINLCVGGPIAVGLAAVAKFRFGSAAAFGTFLSCFSGGTLAGFLLGGLVKNPRRRGLQFIVMGALAGFELIAIGLILKLVAIGVLLAVMGLGVGFVNVQFSAWIQMRVEPALMGRVMSVVMFSAVGMIPFSYWITGVLADWRLAAAFIAPGALLAATSCFQALTSRAAREID
jgi:MFS family permease